MLKSLKGKTIYNLNPEEFKVFFCQHCHEYGECPKDPKRMLGCKAFVDSGLFDKFYRKD